MPHLAVSETHLFQHGCTTSAVRRHMISRALDITLFGIFCWVSPAFPFYYHSPVRCAL